MTGGQKLMAVCVFAGYTALFVSVVWPRVARRIRANQVGGGGGAPRRPPPPPPPPPPRHATRSVGSDE
jgi:hypothetical protein